MRNMYLSKTKYKLYRQDGPDPRFFTFTCIPCTLCGSNFQKMRSYPPSRLSVRSPCLRPHLLSYLDIVRNKILVDIQGKDVLYQARNWTRPHALTHTHAVTQRHSFLPLV